MKVTALTLTLGLLLVGAPLWADSPSSNSVERKSEEPEFNIRCKNKAYLHVIGGLQTELKSVREKFRMNEEFIKTAQKEGRVVGPSDLPGRPPHTFIAPSDTRASVFLRRVVSVLSAQERYYQDLQPKSLLRVRGMLSGNEQFLKDVIVRADERCIEVESNRATSASLGEALPHASALAAVVRPNEHNY